MDYLIRKLFLSLKENFLKFKDLEEVGLAKLVFIKVEHMSYLAC